jgi:alginate production protein
MTHVKVFLCAIALITGNAVSNAQPTPLFQRHISGGEPLRRPDDRRPADQWTFWLFNRPLTIGGELESDLGYERNFSLSDGAKDAVLSLGQELVLEFSYPFTKDILLFVEGITFHESDLYAVGHRRRFNGGMELGQAWIHLSELLSSKFSLRIGRQAVWEDRNWWWDDDLDAVRLMYEVRRFKAEFGVARELGRLSTERLQDSSRDIVRLLGRTEWEWTRDHWLDSFFLYHNDRSNRHFVGQRVSARREDPSDAEMFWLGTRVSGELDLKRFGELEYLLDGAWVRGRDIEVEYQDNMAVASRMRQKVSGWALNAALGWETKFPAEPTLTLGYAVGSGDRTSKGGSDRGFRQTGIHSNEGRFNGVNYFHYYGELLQPELSNLQIWTIALGFPFWGDPARWSSFTTCIAKSIQPHSCATPALMLIRPGKNVELGKSGMSCWGCKNGNVLKLSSSGASSVPDLPTARFPARMLLDCSSR